MTVATPFGSPAMADLLVEELMPRYSGAVSRRQVTDAIQAAISDLRGSICREALPEMATRLAMFRLDGCGDRTATDSRDAGAMTTSRDIESAARQ